MPQLPNHSLLSDITLFSKTVVGRSYYNIVGRSRHARAQKLSDFVIVATPDLLPLAENAIYLPNPIDTDHFKRCLDMESSKDAPSKKILMISNDAIDTELVLAYCRNRGLDNSIEVYDRIKNPISYANMPNFLRKYSTYLDVRFINGKLISGISKTALESLACGLSIIDYDLKQRMGFPPEHDPRNVVCSLFNIYCN
jgi:hypothetical protein